jgi:hypothetical protein
MNEVSSTNFYQEPIMNYIYVQDKEKDKEYFKEKLKNIFEKDI